MSADDHRRGRSAAGHEALRQRLLDQREALLEAEASGARAEESVELDQSRVGRLTRMDALQGQAMSRETGRRRRLALREIDRALERLDAGEYGDCRACGEPIDPRRLDIQPTTQLCLACAQAQE